jgi:hypothetical protein
LLACRWILCDERRKLIWKLPPDVAGDCFAKRFSQPAEVAEDSKGKYPDKTPFFGVAGAAEKESKPRVCSPFGLKMSDQTEHGTLTNLPGDFSANGAFFWRLLVTWQ